MMITDIGTRIKSARATKQLTLKDVADKTGLSVSYISDLERGRTEPSLKTIRKLRHVLDINMAEHKLTYDELQLIEAWRSYDVATMLRMIATLSEDK